MPAVPAAAAVHIGALEPAHFRQLAVARPRLRAAVRYGLEPDHQRARERPRLRGDVADLADLHARLLAHLAPDRLLERLAGLDEAGQHGEAALRPARLAAEQKPVAVHHAHDHDRVGAREVVGVAGRAVAFVAAVGVLRGPAAVGAEAVAPVPGDERCRVRGERRLISAGSSVAASRSPAGRPRSGSCVARVLCEQRPLAGEPRKTLSPFGGTSTRRPSSSHSPRSDSTSERAAGSRRLAASHSGRRRSTGARSSGAPANTIGSVPAIGPAYAAPKKRTTSAASLRARWRRRGRAGAAARARPLPPRIVQVAAARPRTSAKARNTPPAVIAA